MEIDIFKVTKAVNNIVTKNELPDINHFTFHPGGKKILQTVEDLFANLGKNLKETREVFYKYGNINSVTVLYVLEEFIKNKPKQGNRA